MNRDELQALLKYHNVHGLWCDGCGKQVGTRVHHLTELLMPAGVDYLLQAKEIV